MNARIKPTKAAKSGHRAPRRSAGRPTEDTVVGKTAIINATVALMRTKTLRELSVVEVAAAAGVDPALICRHSCGT